MRILIADDEENIRKSLAEFLKMEGFETELAENGLSAQRLLLREVYDAAVVDLKMPGMTGLELLAWLQEEGPAIPVIMISAFGEVRDAVEAIKLGAFDYLVKPFNPEELLIKVRRAVEERKRAAASVILDNRTSQEPIYARSSSPSMKEIERLVAKVSPTDSTVLLTGESGTGKEVYARQIHDLSSRARGPFMPVNIGGIPENLLESELFGFEKGAFTGADKRKEGLIEVTSGGTLFLDEIGDMPLGLQVKMLRVIQERRMQHLGGLKEIPVDVRIIAATNRDLEAMVRGGRFREDLFYRLNVIRLSLPPLRDRKEDLPGLTAHLLRKLGGKLNKKVGGLTSGAYEILSAYNFPGNIRELENILERAIILSETELLGKDDFSLPRGNNTARNDDGGEGKWETVKTARSRTEAALTIKELERDAIGAALLRWEGNRTEAAKNLGISRRTLFNKMKEYGIDGF